MSKFGERIDDSTVRFERMLPGPIERVWEYLTDSDKRATWLAAGGTELRVGGNTEMHFHNAALSNRPDLDPPQKYRDMPEKISFGGTVTRCEPPHVLTYTWDFRDEHSEVTYELEAVDGVPIVTDLAALAREAGLLVHPYTFRADDMPPGFASFEDLVRFFVEEVGVDGLFTDFPDRVVSLLGN